MEFDFETRLKRYLMNILFREENPGAWKHLKGLGLTSNDLVRIIRIPAFAEEAWEMLKAQNPTHAEVLDVAKFSEKKLEAATWLLAHSPLENTVLESLIKTTQSDEAAGILLKQDPSNEELECVMRYTNLQDEAATLLLGRAPNNDELIDIMDYSSLKMQAWEQFLQQSPTAEELCRVVLYTELENLAWPEFVKRNPENEDLLDLVNDYGNKGRKRKEAAEILLQRDLNIQELKDLILNDQFADEAWEKLKAKSPECDEIEYLIRGESVKANAAAEYCLERNPDSEMLWKIFYHTDKQAEAATHLIQLPLELHEWADIVLSAPIEPVLNELSQKVQFDRASVNESELINALAKKLLATPDLLDSNHWHDGEKHCLGGWAIMMHEEARRIEQAFGSEIAASLLLPNYTHLFFEAKTKVLAELQKIVQP